MSPLFEIEFNEKIQLYRRIEELLKIIRSFKKEHHSGCIGQGVQGHCSCGAKDFNERTEKLIRGEQ